MKLISRSFWLVALSAVFCSPSHAAENPAKRGLWGSVCGTSNATSNTYKGSLNRQPFTGTKIDSRKGGRVFTVYRYDVAHINGTKENPSFYGDILGDWREELIYPDGTKTKDLKIFSSWIPSEHRFPWLMTDHVYQMSALNQNIGYNQPTHTGYYLGSDIKSDEEAWISGGYTSAVEEIPVAADDSSEAVYDLKGREVKNPSEGLYIRAGKKIVIK